MSNFDTEEKKSAMMKQQEDQISNILQNHISFSHQKKKFIKNTELHTKIAEKIYSIFFENSENSENQIMQKSAIEFDESLLSKISEYLRYSYKEIMHRYTKIQLLNQTQGSTSKKLIKYIFQCFAKDKCEKLDKNIRKAEETVNFSTNILYYPTQLRNGLKNLNNSLKNETEGKIQYQNQMQDKTEEKKLSGNYNLKSSKHHEYKNTHINERHFAIPKFIPSIKCKINDNLLIYCNDSQKKLKMN